MGHPGDSYVLRAGKNKDILLDIPTPQLRQPGQNISFHSERHRVPSAHRRCTAFQGETYMFSNEAFARTAERYMDTIYRVAYGWLKNPDDANDVTQDVLIELYKTEKAFESDAHLKN